MAQMVKKSDCSEGDRGSLPGLGRSPGGENGYPLQFSCLENSMNRGTWQATVHGITEMDIIEQLTDTKKEILKTHLTLLARVMLG